MGGIVCYKCKSSFPRSEYYKCHLKRGVLCCKSCWKERRPLVQKIADRLRKRDRIPPKTIEKILDDYDYSSAISQSCADLTIVRYYVDLSLTEHPWNAVVVTSPEARKLPRKRQILRNKLFSKELQEKMKGFIA